MVNYKRMAESSPSIHPSNHITISDMVLLSTAAYSSWALGMCQAFRHMLPLLILTKKPINIIMIITKNNRTQGVWITCQRGRTWLLTMQVFLMVPWTTSSCCFRHVEETQGLAYAQNSGRAGSRPWSLDHSIKFLWLGISSDCFKPGSWNLIISERKQTIEEALLFIQKPIVCTIRFLRSHYLNPYSLTVQ